MEIYAVIVTLIVLFLIFDSLSLRLERGENKEEIYDKTIDNDNALEKISELEEETRRWHNNYQSMYRKKKKLEEELLKLSK